MVSLSIDYLSKIRKGFDLAEENIKKYSELTGKIVNSIPELPKGSFASVMTVK